jgi:hypothetical protein
VRFCSCRVGQRFTAEIVDFEQVMGLQSVYSEINRHTGVMNLPAMSPKLGIRKHTVRRKNDLPVPVADTLYPMTRCYSEKIGCLWS